MEGYSLADIASATKDNDLGGSSWILILLFAMIFGWNGNGFGGNRGGDFSQYATAASQNEILLGQQFQTLGQAVNQIGDGLASSTYALNNVINGVNQNLGNAITSEGRGIQTALAECCCQNQRNVDSVRFDMSNYAAQTQAAIHAEGEATRAMIQQDKIETLQNQISALQLQNAMCGVVKYPQAWTYSAGTSPFCQCGSCGSL